MKILVKHLKILPISFLVALIVMTGCEEESEEEIEFVARVGDKYLTEKEISEEISFKQTRRYRAEYIQNWIDQQVLFQQAVESGILESDSFKDILEESKRKLAGVMYTESFYDDLEIELTDDSLRRYYGKSKSNFITNETLYLVNHAVFRDYDKAVDFRKEVIKTGWESAAPSISDEFVQLRILRSGSEFNSPMVMRALKSLDINETSLVITSKPERFEIVQLVKEIEKGSIPGFDLIKDRIESQMLFVKKKIELDSHLQMLYKKYNVEYKKDLE